MSQGRYHVHQNQRPIWWHLWLWGEIGVQIALGTISPYLNTGFCWNLNTNFIFGGERRCIKHIKICARRGDLRGEIWVQKSSVDIISLSKHRMLLKFEYKLHLGGERRRIKHIEICARMGVLWGEIRVHKTSRDIISLSKHRILLKFEYNLHLWWRTKVYIAHRNLRPDGWYMAYN